MDTGLIGKIKERAPLHPVWRSSQPSSMIFSEIIRESARSTTPLPISSFLHIIISCHRSFPLLVHTPKTIVYGLLAGLCCVDMTQMQLDRGNLTDRLNCHLNQSTKPIHTHDAPEV